MGREVDQIQAFQQGYQEGQAAFIKLVNQYCNLGAENIQQLIQAINEKVTHAA